MALAEREQIDELFSSVGAQTMEVALLPPKGTNPTTRCAFVRVEFSMAEIVCQSLNGLQLDGHSSALVVRVADNQGPVPQQPVARSAAPLPTAFANAAVLLPPPPPAPTHAQQTATSNGLGVPARARATPPAPTQIAPLPVALNASAARMKEQALILGDWRKVAEWQETEYAQAGETVMERVERLCVSLSSAVANGHFHEAATLVDALTLLDPTRAAEANAQAIAYLSAPEAEADDAGGGPAAALPLQPHHNAVSEQVYVGTILSFNWDRHYGFIQSAALGQDAFVSDKQIGSFQVGDQVCFQVAYNNKGQPQAQNLANPVARRPISGQPTAPMPGAKRTRLE